MRSRRGELAPESIRVRYGNALYERDLVRCRKALWERVIAGDFQSVAGLAELLDIHKDTVYHFLSGGKSGSKETVEAILDRLHLTFDEVHRPIAEMPPGHVLP
jgi:hypothetical protein